jgi:hypothetical protein
MSEIVVELDKFKPRPYQLDLCDKFESGKYKKFMAIWNRRAGKDICAFNLMLRAALKKVGVYYYIFPTYSQAKKVIWDSITNSGDRFIDYIPTPLVASKNSQEMKIKLINGSLIQLVGSDSASESLVGTNPIGCVFSEYALQDPKAYQFLRPILLINGGWSLFISTPRGRNSLYDLYKIAIDNPEEWYVSYLTIKETKVVSEEDVQKEIDEGLISFDLAQQEYYCSWSKGVEGAYYSKYLDKMKLNNQIADIPWEHGFKVHTAWDIGVRDSTAIIFFQMIGRTIRIIDSYEKNKEGLEHYVKIIQSKPYIYGKHIAPHDMGVTEFGTGTTRLEKAKDLGIKFILAPKISIMDGIESVRSAFSRMYIDDKKCASLLKALENYRQEYDSKNNVYKSNPLHNSASHFADAMRMLCVSLSKLQEGMTSQDIDKLKADAYQVTSGSFYGPGLFKG